MGSILKPFFKTYIYFRDMDPKKQLFLFLFLLGLWFGFDWALANNYITF